jgi:serine/threonine-protein kinase
MDSKSTTIEDTHVTAPHTPVSPANQTVGKAVITTLPKVQWSAQGPTLQQREVARYETLDVLGSGGMGEVVKARDNDIGRTIAVKRLHKELAAPELYARFVEEVQLVGNLEHPNIPPIHDAGVDTEGYFFVMKHVDGEPLHQIIAQLQAGDRAAHARWTFERRLDVMRKVCEALQYAHSKGIVHRDLKPANIIVGRMGEVFVLDWGIATQRKAKHADDSAHGVIGTPMYMSPEQARGEAVDARSDVFSLCLAFYEFISLRHPFIALKDPKPIMEAIVGTDVKNASFLPAHPHQPTVSADIGHMLTAGLKRDREQRLQSAQAVLDRLDMIASGEVPIQCPITFTRRVTNKLIRFSNRHPLAFMAIASASLVGVLAMTIRTFFF